MTNQDKVILSPEQAKAMLPNWSTIHTFRSPSVNVLIGCDWSRVDIEKEIDHCVCELAGPAATAMNHRLAIHTDTGPLFVETVKESA